MGCGAICGDSGTTSPSPLHAALRSMELIMPRLTKTSTLVTLHTYQEFTKVYNNDKQRFHLRVKSGLQKGEPTPDDTMLRWKLVIYGQDKQVKGYSNCLGLSDEDPPEGQPAQYGNQNSLAGQSTLLYHNCFSQIDKDLDRTFSLPASRRRDFESVLKRIANFFPSIGYTQGMNFVIGFLIISGYSQTDTFWMFVHMAVNRRSLLLGLYEDGFPLNNVFCIIFKNMLKRSNEALYQHLFEDLMVDVSMWAFKWFMTCFVYSFPIEMGKHVWDVLVNIGGLGMVALAVSVTLQLQKYLLEKEDMAELSQFLKSLEEVSVFNHFINFEMVIKKTYQLKILESDFDGTEELGGFYAIYFRDNCQELQRHLRKDPPSLSKKNQEPTQSQKLLEQWYIKLTDQRLNFARINRTATLSQFNLPIESNEKLNRRGSDDTDHIFKNKDEESTAEGRIRGSSNEMMRNNQLSRNNNQIPKSENVRGKQLMSSERDQRRKRVNYLFQRIKQHIEEEDMSVSRLSNMRSSKASQKSRGSRPSRSSAGSIKSKSDNLEELDQLDRLEHDFAKKSKKSVKINNFALPVQLPTGKLSQDQRRPDSDQGHLALKNNNRSYRAAMRQANTFAIAGANVLQVQNYDVNSVSSKNASNNSKGANSQNIPIDCKGVTRSCACKTKTQEHKLSNCDRSSELASSKQHFSDKESIELRNKSQEQHLDQRNSSSLQNVDTHRQRVQTHEHVLAISHGPKLRESQSGGVGEELRKSKDGRQVVEDVEVLPFKKGKRVKEGRVSMEDGLPLSFH